MHIHDHDFYLNDSKEKLGKMRASYLNADRKPVYMSLMRPLWVCKLVEEKDLDI